MSNKYQAFLIRLQNADEIERDWLVMEFGLQNLNQSLRQAVWAAAIPHWFDHEFLNAILGQALKDNDFKDLTGLSFVETFPGRGFNVHERSRRLLLERLWRSNKQRYQKLSKRAAAYAKQQDQSDSTWRVETLYHGLLANNARAKDKFIEQGVNWLNSFEYDKVENLARAVLEASERGQLTAETAAWGYFLQGETDNLYGRYFSAQKSLQQAININNGGLLAGHCWLALGDTNKYLAEYPKARDCYRRALQIYRRIQNRLCEANCIRALGDLHHLLAENSEAENCFQQALTVYRHINVLSGEANCLNSLGSVYNSLGQHLSARSYFQQALPIYQQVKQRIGEANCTRGIGNTYLALAEYSQARTYYQQALPIYQQIKEHAGEAHCVRSLGEIHQALAEYAKAQECYQQALTIYRRIKYRLGEPLCIRDLGELYSAQGAVDSAVSNFQQAAELFAVIGNKLGQAWCSNGLALMYQRRQQYTSALAAFKEALEIYPDEPGFYRNRASLYLEMDDYPSAEADIQQAESMAGNRSAYILLSRAELALWQQQAPQALEYCQKALALRPADGSFRARLALCLLVNGQVSTAASEIAKALRAIYQRHDVEELLRDLDKLTKIYGNGVEIETLRAQVFNHSVLQSTDFRDAPKIR